jgi:hypothetical protein
LELFGTIFLASVKSSIDKMHVEGNVLMAPHLS